MLGLELQNLLKVLGRLPGLGPRSGRRLALHLLKDKEKCLVPLLRVMEEAYRQVRVCEVCGNLDTAPQCGICRDESRQMGLLCVVADVEDLWALERTGTYKGRYHVLGGVLSAFHRVEPKDIRIDALCQRLQEKTETVEIILALNATVEGQTTAHFIQDKIAPFFRGRLTRLAYGVPLGGELDYLDDGTLGAAFKARVELS